MNRTRKKSKPILCNFGILRVNEGEQIDALQSVLPDEFAVFALIVGIVVADAGDCAGLQSDAIKCQQHTPMYSLAMWV